MNRRHSRTAIILLLVVFGVSALTMKTPERKEAKPGDFELTLSADKTEYRVGETPDFSAILTNKSGEEVLLVPALDGSDRGRFPVARYTITRPSDAPPVEFPQMCGNTNFIQRTDFNTVAMDASLDLASTGVAPGEHFFSAPGTYTISLTYDTSGAPEAWYGFGQRLRSKIVINRLIGQVPMIRLTSNSVTITVTGKSLNPKVSAAD